MSPRPLIAGNWKMNGLFDDGRDRVAQLVSLLEMRPSWPADMLVCPPATLVMALGDLTEESPLQIGGQDCHAQDSGAFTGDVSAAMLRDAGCSHVIVGHSERRQLHRESDAEVRAKAAAAHAAGLTAIVCVGEQEAERDAGDALAVVERQLMGSLPIQATARDTVVAYEPVWAIGTGRAASHDDIAEIHDFMRHWLAERMPDGAAARLLYGGSVKPANAAAILALDAVDGALVGGASLSADDFWSIFLAAAGPAGEGDQSGETR